MSSAQARRLGDIDALVLQIRGAGDATCDSGDGVLDATHEATVVVFTEACAIRHATFVTHQDDCDDRPRGVSVRFDGAGNAITSPRARHRATDDQLGTFALRTLGAR